MSVSLSCSFVCLFLSWALILLIILSYSDVVTLFYLIILCVVIFYHYPLDTCQFSDDGNEEYGFRWEGRCGGTERSGGEP